MGSRPTNYEYHNRANKAVATEVVVAPTDELAKAVAEEVNTPDPVNAKEVIRAAEVVVPPVVKKSIPAPEVPNESGNDAVVHEENIETTVTELTV